MWSFFMVTFGCKVNQYETEAVRDAWLAAGGCECASSAEASVMLVNSCAITARGERDARNALVRLRRENPKAILLLTGCATHLVERFVPRRHAQVPEADAYIPQESKEVLVAPAFIEALRVGTLPEEVRTGKEALFRSPTGRPYPCLAVQGYQRSRPVLKVQDGCLHRCTYCIVPQTRGACTSRPFGELLAEARHLFAEHNEIMISGINLGQYGRDWGGKENFWSLLAFLEKELAPDFAQSKRIRISSLEPSQLNAKAIAFLGESQLIAPHLHISLQHASQQVLKRMGRGHYSVGLLIDAIEHLRQYWPVIGLGADIIAGFPGETEADLDYLLQFIAASPLSYAHVFPYSRRPGTAAASFSGQLPRKEKLARAGRIRKAVAERTKLFRAQQCQEKIFHLALEPSERKGFIRGVNEYYVPCFVPEASLAKHPQGFLAVKPLRLEEQHFLEQGLLVEPDFL